MRLPCVGDDGLLAPSSIAGEERNAEWSPIFLDGTASGKDQPEAVVRTRPVTRRRSSRARHLQDTNISWMLVLRSDPFFSLQYFAFLGREGAYAMRDPTRNLCMHNGSTSGWSGS